jgi:hypothetical protein
MEAFPITAHAPAGAEPRHERVPAFRLDAQRHVIADGAAIAIGKDEEERDRRHDNAQHEKGNEDDGKYHGRHIQESDSTDACLPFRDQRKAYRLRAARADAR